MDAILVSSADGVLNIDRADSATKREGIENGLFFLNWVIEILK